MSRCRANDKWRNASFRHLQGSQQGSILDMMFGLFRKDPRRAVIMALYTRVADASRAPFLYVDATIPDTVEGRLEALTVHALLVMRRLKSLPEPGPEVAQEYVDVLFTHVDHGLRELGVGDVVVPKRMKKIAQNFYGRVEVYAEAIDRADAEALAVALARNIPGVASARLAAYIMMGERHLGTMLLEDVLNRPDLFPASLDAPA